MLLIAKFAENVVTTHYKTRTFECVLQREFDELLYKDVKDVQVQYDELHILCVKNVRNSMREYIRSLKDKSILEGGTKIQYTQLKGERYKI